MFAMHINGKMVRNHRDRPFCPKLPYRIDMLASHVASELVALDYINPFETPMSIVHELVDAAVWSVFPTMGEMDGNERYVRVVARCVGKRAFDMVDDKLAEMSLEH